MNLNHAALAATVLGMVAIVCLALMVLGAAVAARAVLHAADELLARRTWRRSTRTAPPLADDGWTALADAVQAPPQPGDVAWLYELHPDATRWEDQ